MLAVHARRFRTSRSLLGLPFLMLMFICLAFASFATRAQSAIDIGGIFHPGEPGQVAWRVIKPAVWNGTLALDLDFAPGAYTAAQRSWYLDRGYAIGGIQRTQNETAYELKKYVDDRVPRRRADGAIRPRGHAAQEMRAGPSKPAYRRRLQTTHCCCV